MVLNIISRRMTLQRRLDSIHASKRIKQEQLIALSTKQTAAFVEPLTTEDLVDFRAHQIELMLDQNSRQPRREVARVE